MATSGEPWTSFSVDPRPRRNAHLRAADADREVVFRVLAQAYGDGRLEREEHDARMTAAAASVTLGQLPPLVQDLVPRAPAVAWPALPWAPGAPGSLVSVPPEELRARAVERWSDRRRGAAYLFLGTTVLTWGLVLLAGWEHSWLLVFEALALLQLARVLLSREEMVRDEVRRLERRQARQQRWARALPPGPWRT